ncbi:MAG: hypothetical protein QMD05_06945 [Candidatus Brocadiaceae bacterium]|nr:hypothetical protein [Candidatus Brocadiaceae bacterium]
MVIRLRRIIKLVYIKLVQTAELTGISATAREFQTTHICRRWRRGSDRRISAK